MVKTHTLIRVYSGEMKVGMADKSFIFGAGDTMLFPRNSLFRVVKYPTNGDPYRAASIQFSEDMLRNYYGSHQSLAPRTRNPELKVFTPHPLLDSLMASLLPYFALPGDLPPNLAEVKVEEAIAILRTIDGSVDAMLAQFDDPGKIDLADFMEKNFMFNMPMERFGYLTGRSLTTFKRDFKKIFNSRPREWIMRRRLEMAHYQIFQNKRKPSEVYFESGFENLSHFSFAFKKRFGYNPTAVMNRGSGQVK